ncbi:MAG: HAMP domain-containing histidine kinase, partial [candidate division Zixibacteria bacterium]|nr:HAMP domain-containing histidine kinase [candidate division Zixibacteria bacterium]
INNPITGILNYAQFAADQCAGQSSVLELLGQVTSEAERIARIVSTLMAFAHQGDEDISVLQLSDVVDHALQLVGCQMRKDGIRLELDCAENLPYVKAAGRELEHVVVNLLSNARWALNRKYGSRHDDKAIRIGLATITHDGREWLSMTIRDSGIGMTEDVQLRACDPFYTTKPEGQGVGLGLAVCLAVVADHGGKLWFDSVVGEYTQANVSLPLMSSADSDIGPQLRYSPISSRFQAST